MMQNAAQISQTNFRLTSVLTKTMLALAHYYIAKQAHFFEHLLYKKLRSHTPLRDAAHASLTFNSHIYKQGLHPAVYEKNIVI